MGERFGCTWLFAKVQILQCEGTAALFVVSHSLQLSKSVMFVHQGAGTGLELDASVARMRLILMGDHNQNGSSSALSHTAMLQPPKEREGRDG
jgi:hypothetical protein